MIKGMIKTGLFLFTVAAISGVLLAYSESLTSPVIKENQLKAEIEAQNQVLPSQTFVDVTSYYKENKISYKVGFDGNNKITGAVFKISTKGFGGLINTMVGIDLKGKVTGCKILSLSETPGLGSKLTSDKFQSDLNQVLKNKANPILKVKKDGGDIDAITAATISSRAFCLGLREAKNHFESLREQIANTNAPDNKADFQNKIGVNK